jgi:RNA:NAD 2'-phosphotransferase (TPT1/KptA family)
MFPVQGRQPAHNSQEASLIINYRPTEPTVLYHVTRKKFLPRIRREGLKPHVPGKVFGYSNPNMTNGKRVVWLTADSTQWKHDKHHRKSWRDPDAAMLAVIVSWNDERLLHYLSWRDPKKKYQLTCPNNFLGWFVYFGTIKRQYIIFP